MTEQLIALACVIVLYFISKSWKIRWLAFKLNCAADIHTVWGIMLKRSGWDRPARHRFEKEWKKDARLRYELAKRIRS